MKRFENLNLEYPQGCIIAKAQLTDCVKVDDEFVEKVYPKNPEVYKGIKNKNDWEGYGFKLENVLEVEPIYINGKLSVIEEFKNKGKKKMILWCFKENYTSRTFYEKMGGEIFQYKTGQFGNKEYEEVSYIYDIQNL